VKPFLLPKVRRDFALAQQRKSKTPTNDVDTEIAQWEALRSIWADCITDVPYYRELVSQERAPRTLSSWEDFHALPVLTRKHLQDHSEKFIRDSRRPHSFVKTAGSTGTPLKMGMSQAEKDLMRAVKVAEWQRFGYTVSSRLFLIWGHSHLLGTGWQGRVNDLRRKTVDSLLGYRRVDAYRLSARLCREYAKALIRFRPIGLIGYASALDLFARYTDEFRSDFRQLGLRFVLATSEPAPRPDTYSTLEDHFGCPVVQEYGGAEFGQVAFKVGNQPFQVYSELNILECGASGEDAARPVQITSLYDRYVPLIRYQVGDAVQSPEELQHGHTTAFDSLAGRVNDVLALPGGDFVHSVAIFHCVHQELSVHNLQMVVTDSGVELHLIAAGSTDERPGLEERIRNRMLEVHPSFGTVRFVYKEDVETNRAGKRRWFVDKRTGSVSPSFG
jgi:phenylacetate-coenzyme A ligase PaaK-like adenylate-forming protein